MLQSGSHNSGRNWSVMLPLPSAHMKRALPESTSTADPDSQNGAFEVKPPPSSSSPLSSDSYPPLKTSSNGVAAEPAPSAAMALAAPKPTRAMRIKSSAGFRRCCEVPATIIHLLRSTRMEPQLAPSPRLCPKSGWSFNAVGLYHPTKCFGGQVGASNWIPRPAKSARTRIGAGSPGSNIPDFLRPDELAVSGEVARL